MKPRAESKWLQRRWPLILAGALLISIVWVWSVLTIERPPFDFLEGQRAVKENREPTFEGVPTIETGYSFQGDYEAMVARVQVELMAKGFRVDVNLPGDYISFQNGRSDEFVTVDKDTRLEDGKPLLSGQSPGWIAVWHTHPPRKQSLWDRTLRMFGL